MSENSTTEEVKRGINYQNLTKEKEGSKEFKDELTRIAAMQLNASSKFKEPLLEKWRKYEDLYAGKVPKKLRIPFQVALPVFSGMLDTLAASYDEPIEIEFSPNHPSQYFKAEKIQGAWNTIKTNMDKDARWDYKARIDKKYAIMHGRGILESYARSNPKYKHVIDNCDPLYFHCQPQGGGILEKHAFAGREDIYLTIDDIQLGVEIGSYDAEQVKLLEERSKNDQYRQDVSDRLDLKLQRFTALRLNAQQNNFVGTTVYNVCKWVLSHGRKRWYLVFCPLTLTWIRCEPLKELFSMDLMPWDSWATHEDDKVFWSKSYADEIYPVADAVVTLFNQELTNREKRNLGARAYDKDMFKDVAKLDAAQYRADALVPADTKGGTRKISEGIYRFDTAELQGTIELLDWTRTTTGKDTGITDMAQGAAMDATKKVNVAYLEQAAVAKRIGYKSQSYSECWGSVGGVRFIQGLKDHMSQKIAIQTLGDRGFEWDEITRDDLDYEGEIGVRIISSTARKEESKQKKQGRIAAVKMLIDMKAQNVNANMMTSAILRDIGEYDDSEIKLWLDTNNFASKESIAKAHIAIQKIISNKKPAFNYAADQTFLMIIRDYAMEHKEKLGMEKFNEMMTFFMDHAKQAHGNTVRQAKARGRLQAKQMMMNGTAPVAPTNPTVPTPAAAPATM